MNLSTAQLAALKTDVTTSGGGAEFSAAIANKSWQIICDAYNTLAPGPWIVWNTIPKAQVIYAIQMADYVPLVAIKQAGLDLYLRNLDSIDAGQPNVQAAFQAIFGASPTLTALVVLAKRSATRAEKLFSTGTGSTASPATINAAAAVGTVTIDDVAKAMG